MFNTKEKEIIEWGLQNGKSKQEAMEAVANYRLDNNPYIEKETPIVQEEQSFAQDAVSDVKQIGSEIKETFESKASTVGEALEDFGKGEQGGLRTFGQVVGQGALAVSETIGSIFKGISKAVLPQKAETAIAETAEKVIKPIAETDIAKNVLQRYSNLDEKTKRDIDAILGITMLGADVVGAGVASKLVKPIAQVAKTGIKKGAGVATDIAKAGIGTTESALKPISGLSNYIVSRTPKAMGIFTAEGDDAVKSFLLNPGAADIGLKQGDEALKAVIARGKDNAFKMRESLIKGHALAKEEVMGKHTKSLVPKKNVNKILDDLFNEYDVSKTKKGSLNFDRSKITTNPGEVSQINKVFNRLNAMTTATVNELDDFKQFANSLIKWETPTGSKKSSALLKRFSGELDDIITSKLPKDLSKQYSILNKNFSETIGMYNDFVKAFEKGDPFKRIAGVFGQNNATIRELITKYEAITGEKVFSTVAGRAIGMEKSAPFGFLNPRSWIDLLVSPQTQGRIVAETGSKIPKKHLEPFIPSN